MSRSLRSSVFAASVVLTVALMPHALQAQGVTAQELWGAWQDGVAVAGGTLSAGENREGNQLVLSDLRLDMGDDAGVFQLQEVRLTNLADGSVGVILPDSFPLMFELPRPQNDTGAAAPSGSSEYGGPEKLFVTVTAPDLALIVRGLGDRAEFQASAPDVTLVLDRVVPPIPDDQGIVALNLVLADFSIRYLQDLALEAPMIDGALSFGGLDASLSVTGRDDGDAAMAFRLGKSDLAVSGALPVGSPEFEKVQAGAANGDQTLGAIIDLIGAGLRASASLNIGPARFSGDVNIKGETPTRWNMAIEETALSAGLDAANAGYSASLKGADMYIEGEIEDFPGDSIGVTLGEYRLAMNFGLNGLRGPQDWSLAYVFRDFTMSDSVWDALELSQDVPRDPATLAVDISGRYAIRPEALGPDFVADAQNPPLSELSFRINEAEMDMMGLKLLGQGGLGFDFSDLTTFDGIPAPAGRVNFLITGVYGLIDLMVKNGAMDENEAAGLRTGLLMVGRAGEAPDTLHSDLDFRDKSFYLNGIKIR